MVTNTANPSDRQTNLSATASSTYPLGPAAATDHTPLGSVALPAPTRLLGLSVQHYPLVGITVMVVDGELDLLTAPVVEQYLRDQLVAQPAHLILDLESVRFLGASGLSCLLGARELVGARGSQLHLAGLITSVVQRAVKATGLLGLFSTYPTLLHAVIDLADRPDVTTTDHGIPPPVLTAQVDHNGAGVSTLSESSVGTEHEYAHLVPLQRRYAKLGADSPEQQQLREQLISGYLPVAEHIARRFAGRGEPLEDLIQVATVGLINAVDRFEPARGSQFLSFAVPTITGGLRRYFRDYGWSTRVPRRTKDLTLTIKRAQAQLYQQLNRSPRPSEIADQLGVSLSQVIEALHAAEAYRSSS